MNRRLAFLSAVLSPILAGVVTPALIHVCILLFLIFPPLIVFCVDPFKMLLPPSVAALLTPL